MRVHVQAVNFKVDKELVQSIDEKLKGLLKYYEHIVDAQVHLKVQKMSEKDNKIIEIRLGVPGNDTVLKKVSNTFEDALLQAVAALKKSLIKLKEKQRNKGR